MNLKDLKYFDWTIFFLVVLLTLIGILTIYSATYTDEQPYSVFFIKQIMGFISGIIIFFIFCFIDYKKLYRWGYYAYFIVLGLLFFTLLKGSVGGFGGQRWINFGIFKFQPSELPKLFFPAYITYYLETKNDSPYYSFKDFIPTIAILGISCLLILKQPDLGTAIIILLSGLTMFWLSGIKKNFFIWSFLLVLLSAPISWNFLKPYQKQRIAVYFGYGQMQKERYQIEQSKIAIGSGGFTGKGFLKGTQNRFYFLPIRQTDFIFSVICEEFGFIGALIVILLFFYLFLRLLLMITSIQYFFDKILAIGLIAPIIFSTIINIAMVSGLLPTVGIPLPFVSYGLTNLWVTFASLGWVYNISLRKS